MFKKSERRNRRGFTLAEVLIVVAIIGILLAVAIPNVISYYRSLKLTELDDSARTIFMAAQNRLTAMKSAGANLYALSTVEVNEKPDPGVGAGRFLAVTSAQADSLASLVPGGSIESQLHDNHYVVEIDAKTGAVYAVWYWEKEDFDYTSEAYGAVKPAKSDRLDAGRMVGYYGGSFVDRPNIGQTPMPSAQVINAEELALNITVRGDGFTGTPPSIKATITLINGSVKCVIVSDANLKYDPFENVFTGRIALDTLDGSKYTLANNANSFESGNMGKPFKDWVYDTMALSYIIAPGANFDIEVKVTAVDTSGSTDPVNYLPQHLYWTDVNSLFASVEEDSVTGEPVTAHIAYGRHLQNLDTATSGATNTITAAEQTRSIDFNDSASVKDVYSWADTYGSMFKPIENASLTSYNGHEYEIRNLNIQENTSGYLGLFGFLSNYNLYDTIKFEKIILVNTKSEEGIVGALVGGLGMNGYIDNCHVYLDEIRADGKLIDTSTRLKGSSVGGLVGVAYADLTMTNCSAATVISSAGNAGGLVSNVAGICTISKSYAACNLTGAYVGGLVGLGTGGVTIQNSYAAGTADVIDDAGKARKVAGLVNWADGTVGALPPTLTSSYAAVRYGKSVTDARASNSLKDFFGACEIKADVTVSGLYYVKQAGITYEADSGEAVSMSKLKGMIGTTFTSADWYDPGAGVTVNPQGLTYPYNILDDGLADPYPYPMLASDITAVGGASLPMPHYGDWLENSYATSFYWEKEGTEYKFYLVLSNGTTQYIADNLCTEYHLDPATRTDVEAWGYGLIGIDADAVTDAGLTPGDSTVTNKTDITTPLKSFLADTGTTWNGARPVGPLEEITALLSDDSNVILLKGAEKDDFHAIETGAGYLELNLGFAAAIDVTRDAGTAPGEATYMGKEAPNPADFDADRYVPYQIRTVQQLDNMGGDGDSTTNYFKQTHDVNGTGYDNYKGIGTFSGNYNGGFYRILDLKIGNGGLFRSLKNAKVENVILYSPTNTATLENYSGSSVGGIAWETTSNNTSSTITNCIVAGYIIDGNGSHVGGLVGHHLSGELIIEKCAAVNTLSGNRVGGLVGLSDTLGQTATASELKIIDSYAGGSIKSANGSTGGLVGSNTAGNNQYQDGNVTYEGNVYSYVNMDSSIAATRVYGIGPGTVSGGTAKYWKNGLPSSVTPGDNGVAGLSAVSLSDLTISPTTTQHTYVPDTDTSHSDEERFENGLTKSAVNYPFTPVVTANGERVHYGSWPDEPAAGSLCYYDVVGGNYGVWGYIDPTKPIVNTLAKGDLTNSDLEYATQDGYCVLVENGKDEPEVKVDGVTGTITLNQISGATYTDGTTTYNLYKINGLDGVDKTNYYTKITVGDTDYWFNPYFACEVQKPGTGTIADAEPMKKPGAAGEGDTEEYDGKVIIRTARQLANLAAATGAQYNQGTTSQQAAQNRNYVQLLDIDYDKYTGADLTFGTSANKQTPASLNSGSYDGNNFLIRNLYIGDGTIGDGTGLFGRSKGNMSNIRLVNISVESTDNNKYVGALAGRFQGDTLTNCGVYVDSANAPAGISDAYGTFKVSGSDDRVGGLIGNLNSDAGATVTKCFAAVKVEGGGDRVGGLIGALAASNNNTELIDCYSAGHTVGSTYTSDANVTGARQVGGLIGCVVGDSSTRYTVTLSGINYSTCSVKGSNSLGLLVGAQTGQAEIVVASGGTAYATGVAFNDSGAETTPQSESYLTKPTVTTKSGFTTHAYDDTLTGDYPYETNLNEHYGDWVIPKFQVSGYIYWELEGGAYHYSVTAWDREKGTATWDELSIGSTLCNEYDTTDISNYGYGWFYAGDFDGSTPTMTDATASPDNDAANALKSSLNTALETALPGVDLGTVTVTAYSYGSATPAGTTQTWTIQQGSETLQTATLNPDFADTINRDATTPYKVRTIRQLQNINHTAYLAQSFTQGHDLDGDGFTYTPIGNGTGDFTGRYDGKGYRIRNLDISVTGEDACAGLFGKASGSANFERIIMWGNDNTISASDSSGTLIKNSRARVGGIVAEIPSGSVTISNCVVTGYRLEVSATGAGGAYTNNVYVGGIVANLNGTVTNCEAVVEIRNNNGTAYIGGLVGEIGEDSTGGVANSYAGGTITTSDTHCVGGVVGESNGKSIENCYSCVTGATYAINAHRSGLLGSEHNETRSSCAYFGNAFANNRNNGAQQCANVTALTDWLNSKTTFQNAEHVYDGSGEVSGATFNGAVVQVPTEPGGDPVYVHYGDLPA